MNKYLIIFCIIILAIIITVSVVLILNNKNNKKTITSPGIWHPPFTLITPEEFAQFMLDNSIINDQEYVEILKDKDPNNNINKQSLTTTTNQINTTYTNTLSLDAISYNKIKNSLASLLLYVPDNLRNNIITKFNNIFLNTFFFYI